MAKKQKYEGTASRAGVPAWTFDPDELIIVGLDVPVDEDNEHLADEERASRPFDEGMVLTIMSGGVRQPIGVTKLDGKPHVVMGRGRVIASREAKRRFGEQGVENLPRVPAIDNSDNKVALAINIAVENEHRLDDSPINRARKMARLKRLGAGPKMIAEAFNCTVEAVRLTMKLLDITPDVQEMVENKEIAASHAQELAGLPNEEQRSGAEAIKSAPKGKKKATAKKAGGKDANPVPAMREVKGFCEILASSEYSEEVAMAEAIRWARGLIPSKDAPFDVKRLRKLVTKAAPDAKAAKPSGGTAKSKADGDAKAEALMQRIAKKKRGAEKSA